MATGDSGPSQPSGSSGALILAPRDNAAIVPATLSEPLPPEREEIIAGIEEARQKVKDNVHFIQEQLSARADWKTWVHDHPLEAVGIAFGLGFLLGARPYL